MILLTIILILAVIAIAIITAIYIDDRRIR